MSWTKTAWGDVIGSDPVRQTIPASGSFSGTIDCNQVAPQKFLSVSIKNVIDFNVAATGNVEIKVFSIDASAADESDTVAIYRQEIKFVAGQEVIVTIPNLETSAIDSLIIQILNKDTANAINVWSSYMAGYIDLSGISGYSGYSGLGHSGYSGLSGYSGMGVSGYSGYSGLGISGYSGMGDRYSTTSSTSLAIGLGLQWLTVDTGLALSVGQKIIIAYDDANQMLDEIVSYNPTTGQLNVNVTSIVGAGTYDSWYVSLTGAPGRSGYSGYGNSGYSGMSGYSGYSGSGISGYSGYSGYSGSGISGYSGYSGYSGSGVSGYSGSGISGYSGYSGGGYSGYSGYSGGGGDSGYSGYSGSGISGYSGNSGNGFSGYSGSGISGYSGYSGGGYSGYSGASGYSGLGVSGYSGYSGMSGYSGSISRTYNVISRYSVVTSSGLGAWITSSSEQYSNIVWARTGTTLTVYNTGHGRTTGERILIREANVGYINGLILSTTANEFTMTCPDSGATSGTNAYYMLGFTFVYNAVPGSIANGTVFAPSGANVVLLSMRIHLGAGTRLTTTFDVVVPNSSLNGAGDNTNDDDVYWPNFMVRHDADSMAGVGTTIAKNVLGNFSRFRFGSLSATTVGLMIALTW